MRNWLERRFGLSTAGSTVGREVAAGVATFAALSYILFVQPAVLSHPVCGMDAGGVLFATCVASGVACLWMGLRANYPVALAPAMGHNFFFAFAVCGAMGFRWQEALAANFVAGALFLVAARFGVRERVMEAVPVGLQSAIAAGIGLLIALVGLEWGGVVVDHPQTFVALGTLDDPVALLTVFGLALSAILIVRRVPAALLVGLVATAAVGFAATAALGLDPALVRWSGVVGAPPAPGATALQLDFAGLFARPAGEWVAVLVTFLVLDLFDTVGTLLGVGRRAGLLVDGRLPRAGAALTADAVGTVTGALLGTSTVTSYVESAAGVATGGRTGLTAVVTGLCLFAALVFTPLVETLGGGVNVGTVAEPILRYPVLAPTLVLVGVLMAGATKAIDWEQWDEAIPAFLTLVIIPLSFSIADGMAWGFIAYSLLAFAAGRGRAVPPLVHVLAGVFVARYAFG